MKKPLASLFWLAVALLGAFAYVALALHRGEHLNSAYILTAALCTYTIGYRFYSKWIAARVLTLNDRRATPCEVHDDGKDFVKTNKWIVFGHHFAAISGPGPLVGPVLAAQFGYLPGTLWILIGCVLGGAVQDFVILFCSMRRDGKSLGQMVKEELNTPAGFIALIAILAIMVILLAVLALVVVKALAESPWGVFTVGATIPIAMFMGGYMRFWRIGKVREASVIGVVGLLLAVWGGKLVYESASLSKVFAQGAEPLAWAIILYGLAASVLPVWLLLAPRDYLSTFMKLGTIFALAVGIFCVLPHLQMPALTRFVDGSGLVLAGKLFPFCFITIACGAISGFHTLIASGTTPKLITRESYARPIGYGAMCLESLVAIMAIIAACTMEPGVYFAMNVKGEAAVTAATVTAAGFPVTVEHMEELAKQVGEHTLFGRTGGAATLAVGMAQIFSKAVSGRWLDLWYHFAIMFEALFILTTIDAGTRVARYILHDFLGHVWKPLGNTRNLGANLVASGLMVCGWGYFLVQGVRDPLGGINSLWPLFGIANQMLAAIALCLAVTIIFKMALQRRPGVAPVSDSNGNRKAAGRIMETGATPVLRSPWFALIALVPLVWLLSVTFTAGVQKIWHPDPRIGFLAQVKSLDEKLAALQQAGTAATTIGEAAVMEAAAKAVRANRTLRFNNLLDAFVAGVFLILVSVIVLLSLREWILLLSHRKPAELRESPPTWLPDYAVVEGGRNFGGAAGTAALALALSKELSGEAAIERAHCECRRACESAERPQTHVCGYDKTAQKIYLEVTEQRFNGVRRCC
ncbi:MAG: carbon starvation protein A [Verrucomicrobia bacterium]|jgi:carbon starvation protein|nr:carbon starvation protein A [Verrucomicrobiota bacterium]